MLLVATWQAVDQNRQKAWQFQTPLGLAFASLREEGKSGSLVVYLDVSTGNRYTDPGRYSAIGALAFLKCPEIRGALTKLRLTAIPPAWVNSSESVLSVLKTIGLRARIVGRTLEVESEKLPPPLLLRRTALAVYSLDSFSKTHTPEKDFDVLRLATIKTFRDDGHDLFDYFEDVTGAHALKALLSPRTAPSLRPRREARTVLSDESAPEIPTRLGRTIRVQQEQWDSTRETFSRWTVDPKWLIYLPAGMCSLQTDSVTGPLEHPTSAFEYYRNEQINKVVVEFKHMGSRAIVIVCRDDAAAQRRFGVSAIGCVYTRNGRPFFADSTGLLIQIREGLTRARFWEKFETDWACIDGECLPWTVKSDNLIEKTHRQLLISAEATFDEMAANRSLLPSEQLLRIEPKRECYERYRCLLDRYQAEEGTPPRFAPFQLIATEKAAYFDRTHQWHMEVLQAIVRSAGDPFMKTPYRFFALDDGKAVEECVSWWDDLSKNAAEGLVVKPLYGVPRGRRGLAQPAIKCRTPEHLRLVYGPEYDQIENRWQLASREGVSRRREKHKRVLKQLALSIEGVERFVSGEPTNAVDTCVRALLSLEK